MDWYEQEELEGRRQDHEEWLARRERFMEVPDGGTEEAEEDTGEDTV